MGENDKKFDPHFDPNLSGPNKPGKGSTGGGGSGGGPKFKNPFSGLGSNPKMIWAGVAVLTATIGGIAIKKYMDSSDDPKKRRTFAESKIDSDFFAMDDEAETVIEEKEHKPVKRTGKRKAKPKPKPKKPKRPTASELFEIERRTAVKERRNARIAAINSARYGQASILIAKKKAPGTRTEYIKSQEKWNEPQIKPSLPVKLDRVFTVDRFIPAILINEIDSELGGKVTAVVEKNVYSAHGRNILIPAGTKAIGMYKPLTKVGEERLRIIWPRFITPDGINIHTGDAEMTDAMGRIGITGDVDRRYFERYGMALMVSILTAATTYSIPVENANQQLVVESFGKEVGGLSKAILEEHLAIKPKVKIPAGSRINLTASKDIWFKKVGEREVVMEDAAKN